MAPEDWFVLAQAATDIEQNSTCILSALTDCSPCVSDAQVARRKPAVAQRLFEPQPGGGVRFRRGAMRRHPVPNHSGQDDAGATAQMRTWSTYGEAPPAPRCSQIGSTPSGSRQI